MSPYPTRIHYIAHPIVMRRAEDRRLDPPNEAEIEQGDCLRCAATGLEPMPDMIPDARECSGCGGSGRVDLED